MHWVWKRNIPDLSAIWSMVMSLLLLLSQPSMVVSALARPPEPVFYHAPCHQCFVFEDVFPKNRSSLNPDNICKTAEQSAWCSSCFHQGSLMVSVWGAYLQFAKSVYLLHCSMTDQLSVSWDPGVLQLVPCGTFNWKVTLLHPLCPLKLLTSACLVLDIMPPWRHRGFSPGNHVCSYAVSYLLDWTSSFAEHYLQVRAILGGPGIVGSVSIYSRTVHLIKQVVVSAQVLVKVH